MAEQPWLHLLTSDEIVSTPDFESRAQELMATGRGEIALHLRTRLLSGRTYVALAQRICRIARETTSMVVVNARADIALASGAHGVQLGRGSLDATDVRAAFPGLAIGVSIHSPEEPPLAHPADWLLFGHLFETQSHAGVPGVGLESLRAVASAATCPVIALGGITPSSIRAVLEAGAAGVAVLSGVWSRADPAAALSDYLSYNASRRKL